MSRTTARRGSGHWLATVRSSRRRSCTADRAWPDARRRSVRCAGGVHRGSAQARVRLVRRRCRLSAKKPVRPRPPPGQLVAAGHVPAGKWLLSGRNTRMWAPTGTAEPDAATAILAHGRSPARTSGPGHHAWSPAAPGDRCHRVVSSEHQPVAAVMLPVHPHVLALRASALRRHGLRRGGWLTARRLLRCRPGTTGGNDPASTSHDTRHTPLS